MTLPIGQALKDFSEITSIFTHTVKYWHLAIRKLFLAKVNIGFSKAEVAIITNSALHETLEYAKKVRDLIDILYKVVKYLPERYEKELVGMNYDIYESIFNRAMDIVEIANKLQEILRFERQNPESIKVIYNPKNDDVKVFNSNTMENLDSFNLNEYI